MQKLAEIASTESVTAYLSKKKFIETLKTEAKPTFIDINVRILLETKKYPSTPRA